MVRPLSDLATFDNGLVRLVTLTEVNLGRTPPIAQARDNIGSMYTVILSRLPPGIATLPQQGERWWIDKRSNQWCLQKRDVTEEVRVDRGSTTDGLLQRSPAVKQYLRDWMR